MESRWGPLCVTVLGFLTCVQGQRDFDLADALDDSQPTKKPNSGIYPNPRPPYDPPPGLPDNSGGIYPKPRPPYDPQPGLPDNSGGIYPKPRPPYDPQPGMPDNSGGSSRRTTNENEVIRMSPGTVTRVPKPRGDLDTDTERKDLVRTWGDHSVCTPRREASAGRTLDPAWISDSQPQPCLDRRPPASTLSGSQTPRSSPAWISDSWPQPRLYLTPSLSPASISDPQPQPLPDLSPSDSPLS
ncbi:glycoprotein Xg isoform X2 [Suricata suricatta]|uniref:glycoprotein Xg isoform X2 n=1 Tax=Suricata suricatta TaxID=37032 RepID=UPI0011556945|nr:glycoprotein Xg isoform X2 [Suricata suricatta]